MEGEGWCPCEMQRFVVTTNLRGKGHLLIPSETSRCLINPKLNWPGSCQISETSYIALCRLHHSQSALFKAISLMQPQHPLLWARFETARETSARLSMTTRVTEGDGLVSGNDGPAVPRSFISARAPPNQDSWSKSSSRAENRARSSGCCSGLVFGKLLRRGGPFIHTCHADPQPVANGKPGRALHQAAPPRPIVARQALP